MTKAKKTTKGTNKAAINRAAKPQATRQKMSGLDAAAKVLAEAGKPMNAKAIATAAIDSGYWTTAGQTPWATLYSAMIREIAAKGSDSRFRKSERGMFEAAQ